MEIFRKFPQSLIIFMIILDLSGCNFALDLGK